MDMDDELRELFSSDRLDVAVRPDAEAVIVAGARRVRRRRIAVATAGGALGVLVAIAAGLALAGGDPDGMPPATSNDTTTVQPRVSATEVTTLPAPSSARAAQGTTASVPSTATASPSTRTSDPGPPDLNFQVNGPTGLRALELGQTLEEAQASGLLGAPAHDGEGSCSVYSLVSDGRINLGFVYVSDTVQAIAAVPVQTPEGVGRGWTIAQVKDVYPDLDEQAAANGHAVVAVPDNPAATFRLEFTDGVVDGLLTLQLAGHPCF